MGFRELQTPITVNDSIITVEQIAAEAQNHPVPKGKPGLAWKAAARALAMREILLQEAQARNITPAPIEIGEGYWELDEDAQIRQLLEDAITVPEKDEAALRALYDANPERFRSPALFEAAHILIAAQPDDLAARQQAREQAMAFCSLLEHDPKAFTRLATQHSACTSRNNGGLLGQLSSGDTVAEFEAALQTMPEGTISPSPVETRYGFHIIRLDARVEGKILPFESVLPQLLVAQEKAAWVRASREYAAELLSKAKVTGISF